MLYNNFENIVPTNVTYHYKLLMENLKKLAEKYKFLQVFYNGESILGKKIPYIRLGSGNKTVFYSASIHANEWINSIVLMKFIEDFCKAYSANNKINGFNISKIFENTTIYIAPMLNPDGVDIVTRQLDENSQEYEKVGKIANNYIDIPFPERLEG